MDRSACPHGNQSRPGLGLIHPCPAVPACHPTDAPVAGRDTRRRPRPLLRHFPEESADVGKRLGDSVPVWRADGSRTSLTVVGVLGDRAAADAYTTLAHAFSALPSIAYVKLRAGTSPAWAEAVLRQATAGHNAHAVTRAEWTRDARARGQSASRIGLLAVLAIILEPGGPVDLPGPDHRPHGHQPPVADDRRGGGRLRGPRGADLGRVSHARRPRRSGRPGLTCGTAELSVVSLPARPALGGPHHGGRLRGRTVGSRRPLR